MGQNAPWSSGVQLKIPQPTEEDNVTPFRLRLVVLSGVCLVQSVSRLQCCFALCRIVSLRLANGHVFG